MFNRTNAPLAAGEHGDQEGFTLVELLVVVLIIGALAAISIPFYVAQQKSAQDAGAQSDAANAKLAIVSYRAAHVDTREDDDIPDRSALMSYGWPNVGARLIVRGNFRAFTVCESSPSGEGDFFATATTNVNTEPTASPYC